MNVVCDLLASRASASLLALFSARVRLLGAYADQVRRQQSACLPFELWSCRSLASLANAVTNIQALVSALQAAPHAPDLPAATLAVQVYAQAVQDGEPLVAVDLVLGPAPDLRLGFRV